MSVSSRSRVACLAVLLGAGSPWARADDEEDRQALRSLKDVYEQAANESRPQLLAPHLDEGFTGVMVTGDPVASYGDIEGYWAAIRQRMGPGGRYTVKVHSEPVSFFGDLAVAHGTTDDAATTSLGEYHFISHWTAVCAKREGGWKILRVHASMDPLGNPFVRKALWTAGLPTGLAGALLGLAVGAVAGITFSRRKAANARAER